MPPVPRNDPREEKILDYLHESRNTYGENDKSSRKSIRFRKAWVNRTYRRGVDAALAAATDPDEIADNVRAVRRMDWKKGRDDPLGEVLAAKEARTAAAGGGPPASTSPARREAARRQRRRR